MVSTMNTDGKEIIYLINSLVLIDHLLIYTEEMLCPAGYLCLDAGIRNILLGTSITRPWM